MLSPAADNSTEDLGEIQFPPPKQFRVLERKAEKGKDLM